MKIKQKLMALSLSSLMVCSGGIIYSNAQLQNNTSKPSASEEIKCHKRPRVIDQSVKDLKDSGVLDEKDIKNIEAYRVQKKKMKIEDIKNKKHAIVDDMVGQNVITKEKGQKLKDAIDKNLDARIKEIENK